MKKTTFLLAFFFCHAVGISAQTPTQVSVGGDAKVGLIVTGTGNTINTTQIFGKSPEYAELKKRIDGLQAAITKKADDCEQMRRDSLPARYRDNCRIELIALNAERDSVQKIETRFREDVIRLAESFSKMELNSERLRLAKQFFDEGKIREADNILKFKEISQEGDALLAKKERQAADLQKTDSLLRIKADELALKARLKATDYGDSLRYDSAVLYFEQSRRYAETTDNLLAFALLLKDDNQPQLAINYFEKLLSLAPTESAEAALSLHLGDQYSHVQKIAEAEEMYLHALEIYERLANVNPNQFDDHLATVCMNLGVIYYTNQKMAEAEKMYSRSLEIYERLALSNSEKFEHNLANIYVNLGLFYQSVQKTVESEKMYLRSLDIYERLVKSDSAQFEPYLAKACMNFGIFYFSNRKMAEAQKMYLRSMEIHERLVKSNPAQFEPYLAMNCMNLGNVYFSNRKMEDSEKMYLRSFDLYERLIKSNPAQYEPDLAMNCMNLGNLYFTNQKKAESEKMYLRSLDLYERLAKNNPAQFEPALASICANLGFYYQHDRRMAESEKMYLRSLEIRERLAKSNPLQFEPHLARAYGNLSWLYLFVNKYSNSEAAAEKTLTLDSSQNWVRANLGHSHLLRGEWDKAKQVYEQYIAGEKDPAQAKTTLLKDWDDLEAAGVIPKERMGDVEKARSWLKE